MVLGKLPVSGRPTLLMMVGQVPTALAVGAGGVVWTFLLSSIFSPLSPSLWETVRYRLKYCLKGPLNLKTINRPTNLNYSALHHKKTITHYLCVNSIGVGSFEILRWGTNFKLVGNPLRSPAPSPSPLLPTPWLETH